MNFYIFDNVKENEMDGVSSHQTRLNSEVPTDKNHREVCATEKDGGWGHPVNP